MSHSYCKFSLHGQITPSVVCGDYWDSTGGRSEFSRGASRGTTHQNLLRTHNKQYFRLQHVFIGPPDKHYKNPAFIPLFFSRQPPPSSCALVTPICKTQTCIPHLLPSSLPPAMFNAADLVLLLLSMFSLVTQDNRRAVWFLFEISLSLVSPTHTCSHLFAHVSLLGSHHRSIPHDPPQLRGSSSAHGSYVCACFIPWYDARLNVQAERYGEQEPRHV